MEIVLENPSVPPSARTPIVPSTATATPQLGLPMRPPHHFPQRAAYDTGLGRGPSLTTEDYYARNWHEVTYTDLDGVPTPVTVRRVDKSGLLEIAETDPVTCPRPCVLTGAEDVVAHTVPLRVDRSGLLEAVPEAIDQFEEHYNNDSATKMLDEAASLPRGETLKVDADVNPRVFEGGCLLERPSSLEGQACPDEVDTKGRTVDIKALTEIHFDASKATERLSHLPFSPGPSLRLPFRNDPSRTSPLTGRCTDSTRSRNQKSPEFAARYTCASRKLANSSNQNPITRERPQVGCSKDNNDPAQSTVLEESAVDTSETRHESLLAKGSAEQEDDPPGEERAEAEGCEHTTVENLEEDEVSSFKGSNKLLDNDNVQTLRVIILSEQL